MSRLRIAFWSALTMLITFGVAAVLYRFSMTAAANKPLPVPAGDREIAWFHTATNAGTWERFVAGIHFAARQQPRLRVNDIGAFPGQTTAVPEVEVTLDGSPHRLLVRWYKQSAQMTVADWVHELAKRDPPPLAIVGGGSSDRALDIAQALAAQKDWRGPAPVLAITTATARTLQLDPLSSKTIELMRVYNGRSFRFCFTNKQMARAVVDFAWKRSELRPRGTPLAALSAPGVMAGAPIAALAPVIFQSGVRGDVFTLRWLDDPYSMDLANQFRDILLLERDETDEEAFRPWVRHVAAADVHDIDSSVGGFLRPNPDEAQVVDRLINGAFVFRPIPRQPLQRSLLILPTVPPPGRRVLSGLTGASPELGRQLVAVSGDGISFNHVYRDGSLIWNIRLVPIPLVFFAHQNPLAWDDPQATSETNQYFLYPPTATDDVLHFADVFRILAEGTYNLPPSHSGTGPVADADELIIRLRNRYPIYFDGDGNRLAGRGEYVVYLRPRFSGETAVPSATIEVWTDPDGTGWRRVREPLELNYLADRPPVHD